MISDPVYMCFLGTEEVMKVDFSFQALKTNFIFISLIFLKNLVFNLLKVNITF